MSMTSMKWWRQVWSDVHDVEILIVMITMMMMFVCKMMMVIILRK
jgi:hypothetical protein